MVQNERWCTQRSVMQPCTCQAPGTCGGMASCACVSAHTLMRSDVVWNFCWCREWVAYILTTSSPIDDHNYCVAVWRSTAPTHQQGSRCTPATLRGHMHVHKLTTGHPTSHQWWTSTLEPTCAAYATSMVHALRSRTAKRHITTIAEAVCSG